MATLTALTCLFTIQAVVLMDNAVADPNIDINPTEINPAISSPLNINCTIALKNHPDMAAVVSLNLLRANASGQNFEVLAVSTEFSPESVNLVTQEKVVATGVLNETGESFLQVTWDSPTATQGGVYQCAAHGLDMLGQNVELTNISVVTVGEVNLNDIYEKLKQMEVYEKAMENTISSLENDTSFMQNKIVSMETKMSSMENTMLSMENHTQYLENTVSQLRAIARQLDLIGSYQDKEYYVTRENFLDIHESETLCKLFGGTLIEIDDESEYNAIVGFLKNVDSSISHVMIGGTDQESEGNWTLPSTNQPLPFTAWHFGQPSNSTSSNCLLFAVSSGQMYANPCHRTSPYFGIRSTCEIPSVGNTDQK